MINIILSFYTQPSVRIAGFEKTTKAMNIHGRKKPKTMVQFGKYHKRRMSSGFEYRTFHNDERRIVL
jgi:hypothetical protein